MTRICAGRRNARFLATHAAWAAVAAICAVMIAAPVKAQSAREILYASNGPAVRGLSYCHQVMARGADRDRLAQQYGFQVPLTEFGTVHPLDAPRGERRTWRVNYTGSTAGTAAVPDNDALSMTLRLSGRDCEAAIIGVPLSEDGRVVDVAQQILAQLDPQYVPQDPFRRVLVAGTGPAWHGTIWLQHDRFDAGISFGPRIAPYRGAVWELELVDRGR